MEPTKGADKREAASALSLLLPHAQKPSSKCAMGRILNFLEKTKQAF